MADVQNYSIEEIEARIRGLARIHDALRAHGDHASRVEALAAYDLLQALWRSRVVAHVVRVPRSVT